MPIALGSFKSGWELRLPGQQESGWKAAPQPGVGSSWEAAQWDLLAEAN